MKTYVTSFIGGEGDEREELVTYAGQSRSMAFSFQIKKGPD